MQFQSFLSSLCFIESYKEGSLLTCLHSFQEAIKFIDHTQPMQYNSKAGVP